LAIAPGGYTRIIKTGNRLGDNAEMAMIELVDFNEIYTNAKKEAKKNTRRMPCQSCCSCCSSSGC